MTKNIAILALPVVLIVLAIGSVAQEMAKRQVETK